MNHTVHHGRVDAPLPNWRSVLNDSNDMDPDDETLETTPADVVAVLGFDPAEHEIRKTKQTNPKEV